MRLVKRDLNHQQMDLVEKTTGPPKLFEKLRAELSFRVCAGPFISAKTGQRINRVLPEVFEWPMSLPADSNPGLERLAPGGFASPPTAVPERKAT